MRRMMQVAVAVSLVVAPGACADPNPLSTVRPADVLPPGAQSVAMRTVLAAQYSGITTPQQVVIRDAAAWHAFWQEAAGNVTPAPPVPAVDFTQEMVIAAALGQRPTGGYAISIDQVYLSAGHLFVVVLETSPSPGTVVTSAITAPVTAVAVARTDAPVTFTPASPTNR